MTFIAVPKGALAPALFSRKQRHNTMFGPIVRVDIFSDVGKDSLGPNCLISGASCRRGCNALVYLARGRWVADCLAVRRLLFKQNS